jgi:hypothetical protein
MIPPGASRDGAVPLNPATLAGAQVVEAISPVSWQAGLPGAGQDDVELPGKRRPSLGAIRRIGDAANSDDEALVDLDVVGGVLADGVERER